MKTTFSFIDEDGKVSIDVNGNVMDIAALLSTVIKTSGKKSTPILQVLHMVIASVLAEDKSGKLLNAFISEISHDVKGLIDAMDKAKQIKGN